MTATDLERAGPVLPGQVPACEVIIDAMMCWLGPNSASVQPIVPQQTKASNAEAS